MRLSVRLRSMARAIESSVPEPDEKAPLDYYLLSLSAGLMVLGLILLYSASSIWAFQKYHDAAYFLKKQLMWATIGFVSLFVFSRWDFNRLKEWIRPALLVSWVLLVGALFFPPVGGARRWIRLGPVGVQPAEIAKLCLIIYLADYLDRRRSRLGNFKEGLAPALAIMGMTLGLISLEPDLGNPMLIASVGMMMLLAGGINPMHLVIAGAAAVPVIAFEIIKYPYRMQRILTFLAPFSRAQGSGYQLVQSLLAVGSGGWFGAGLGSSHLKMGYLPAPHTDFLFAIVCEELGLVGSLTVVVLFAMFLVRGFKIAKSAPNLFGSLLAMGITLIIGMQGFFNMAVSIGLLPTKGLPLPFFSFGGSSLLITLSAVGILLNISRQAAGSKWEKSS
jgi:cell division protein FtsW